MGGRSIQYSHEGRGIVPVDIDVNKFKVNHNDLQNQVVNNYQTMTTDGYDYAKTMNSTFCIVARRCKLNQPEEDRSEYLDKNVACLNTSFRTCFNLVLRLFTNNVVARG